MTPPTPTPTPTPAPGPNSATNAARPAPSTHDAEAFLERLVRTPSVSRRERAAAELFIATASAWGLHAAIDESGSPCASTSGDPTRAEPGVRDIVLLGHIDTVPGEIDVRREGRILHGRGTVDAKGPLACFLAAASRAIPPGGVRFVVIGAVEEEVATSKGARAAAGRYTPSACLIGEPSGWNGVTLGYKGRLIAEARLERPRTHTAGPNGSSADAVFEFWARVREAVAEMNRGRDGAFGTIQASLRGVEASSEDGLSDRARLDAGFRLPPGVTPGEVEAVCRRCGPGLELAFRGPEHAYVADRSSPVARAIVNAVRDAGGSPALKHKTGTSDMNVVGPVWGCPIAAYGPGDSALDHTPEEHLDLDEFGRAAGVLEAALRSLTAELAARSTRADE
ncbi:MAG: [LysW]-lysine hydrolase [Phycisphaeraceae bacterium]|nr:MAG: [LysW]-lysine hydrolase [Phycisphaeraceae bacterium]